MHDLPDAYSKAIAAATHKANAARRAALQTYEDRQDEINAEFEADIAAAGVALDAGMDSRIRTFRGENQESEVTLPAAQPVETALGDAEPRHVAGGETEKDAREEDRRFLEGLPAVSA